MGEKVQQPPSPYDLVYGIYLYVEERCFEDPTPSKKGSIGKLFRTPWNNVDPDWQATLFAVCDRIAKQFDENLEIYTTMFGYLTRLEDNGVTLNPDNCHGILCATMLTAIKYTKDLHYTNRTYAKCFGLRLSDLNKLEVELLFKSGISLFGFQKRQHELCQQYLLSRVQAATMLYEEAAG